MTMSGYLYSKICIFFVCLIKSKHVETTSTDVFSCLAVSFLQFWNRIKKDEESIQSSDDVLFLTGCLPVFFFF